MDNPQIVPLTLKPAKKLFNHKEWESCWQHYRIALYSHSGSSDTIRNADSVMRRFFKNPSKRPDDYLQSDVEDFIGSLTNGTRKKGTPPAASTRNMRLGVLKSFYAYATQYTYRFNGKPTPLFRAINPTNNIAHSKTIDINRAFRAEELARFFAAIPHDTIIGLRDRAMFLCYLYTARRRTEILLLKWCDLRTQVFEDGRGNAYKGYSYKWRGKGHTSKDDEAELPKQAIDAVQEYLDACGRWGKMSDDEYIFQSVRWDMQPNRPLERYVINVRFRKYCAAAGLAPGLVIHSFRYTHAIDRYKKNGKDIMEVRNHLRHKRVDTTLRYLEREEKPIADQVVSAMAQQYDGF